MQSNKQTNKQKSEFKSYILQLSPLQFLFRNSSLPLLQELFFIFLLVFQRLLLKIQTVLVLLKLPELMTKGGFTGEIHYGAKKKRKRTATAWRRHSQRRPPLRNSLLSWVAALECSRNSPQKLLPTASYFAFTMPVLTTLQNPGESWLSACSLETLLQRCLP